MSGSVVLIFGASGTGKSTLLGMLVDRGRQYSIHMKATSRPERQYDNGIEIDCVDGFEADRYDYVYRTYGAEYGIERDQIEAALREGRHHFIICNDVPTIRSIRRDFPDSTRVVFFYFDAPRKALEEIQRRRGISDDEIDLRLRKMDGLYRTFVEEYDLFDGAVCNRFGESVREAAERLERLLERFAAGGAEGADLPDREGLMGSLDADRALSAEGGAGAVIPNYIFIVMAMIADPHLEDTHHTVRRVTDSLGFNAERVDDIDYSGEITEKVLSSIRLSSLIIADLTLERPNVYLEVGYALAFNKPMLLIARDGTRLHFDVQGRRVEFYNNQTQLEGILQRFVPKLVSET